MYSNIQQQQQQQQFSPLKKQLVESMYSNAQDYIAEFPRSVEFSVTLLVNSL